MIIDVENLRSLLVYKPNTGLLFWLPRERDMFGNERAFNVWNAKHAGREAFTFVTLRGHKRGTIFGRQFLAHRVAWALFYGKWAASDLDHVNGIPADNRISNLRLATKSENQFNTLPLGGASEFKGVSRNNRSWQAKIKANCREHYLGTFETEEAAARAYDEAALVHHGEFACLNFPLNAGVAP